MERSTILLMGKLIIFVAMFHSYVCLPDGIFSHLLGMLIQSDEYFWNGMKPPANLVGALDDVWMIFQVIRFFPATNN